MWTEEQKNFLQNNYQKMPIWRIAIKLNKEENTVRSMAYRMGIKIKDKKKENGYGLFLKDCLGDYSLKDNINEQDIIDFINVLNEKKSSYWARKGLDKEPFSMILKRLYGLGEVKGKPQTLKQIAEYYNVSPERIRQLRNKAFRKLRHPSNLKRYIEKFREEFIITAK